MVDLAEQVVDAARRSRLTVATAESCTGGLLAAALTDIPGSSDMFAVGLVTYSNEAKSDLAGVPETLLAEHGAVSAPVVEAMASGALARAGADIGVGISGVAGPGGGSVEKPVGLVYVCVRRRQGECLTERRQFDGDRAKVRQLSVARALELILELCSPNP